MNAEKRKLCFLKNSPKIKMSMICFRNDQNDQDYSNDDPYGLDYGWY